MTVRLKSVLPGEDRNGLAGLAAHLAEDPDATVVAVVVLQPTQQVHDLVTGTSTITVGITAIEPLPAGTDAREGQRLLRRAAERRTGKPELPLELERDLDGIGVGPAAADVIADDVVPELPEEDTDFGPGYIDPGFSDR